MGFATKSYVKSAIRGLDEELSRLITSGAQYQGTWNADTNTPTITQGTGVKGHFYMVSVGGIWDNQRFNPGDILIFKNSWERVESGMKITNVPIIVSLINDKTTSLPTTRPDGSPLVYGDYIDVDPNTELPFTIDNIYINSLLNRLIWNGTSFIKELYEEDNPILQLLEPTQLNYESGTILTNVNFTVKATRSASNITKIEFYVDDVLVDTLTTGVESGGNFTYIIPSINSNTKLSAKMYYMTRPLSPKEVSTNLIFIDPIYYGVSNTNTITEDIILAGTKELKLDKTNNIIFNSVDMLPFYAYPASFGNLEAITDSNGVDLLTDGTFIKVDITVNGIPYYCYILDKDPITVYNWVISFV